jgi:hypothetical protein
MIFFGYVSEFSKYLGPDPDPDPNPSPYYFCKNFFQRKNFGPTLSHTRTVSVCTIFINYYIYGVKILKRVDKISPPTILHLLLYVSAHLQ